MYASRYICPISNLSSSRFPFFLLITIFYTALLYSTLILSAILSHINQTPAHIQNPQTLFYTDLETKQPLFTADFTLAQNSTSEKRWSSYTPSPVPWWHQICVNGWWTSQCCGSGFDTRFEPSIIYIATPSQCQESTYPIQSVVSWWLWSKIASCGRAIFSRWKSLSAKTKRQSIWRMA